MLKQKIKASSLLSAKISLAPLGGSPVKRDLGFPMQKQQQTQWCWSAVATSTSLFYNPRSGWTQCILVNQEFNQNSCCQSGNGSSCNKPWYLERALQRTGNLERWNAGAASFNQVQQEIDARHPLGVRIGWSGGGGHFVILDGYDAGNGQNLSIKDPWYGQSTYSYNAFKTGYQGMGSWTHSYYTKS